MTVEFEGPGSFSGTIRLYSIDGRLVLSTRSESSKVLMNTAALERGVYILKVDGSGGAAFTRKILLN